MSTSSPESGMLPTAKTAGRGTLGDGREGGEIGRYAGPTRRRIERVRIRKAVLKALKHADGPMTLDQLAAGPAQGGSAAQLRETMGHLVKPGHVVVDKAGADTALRERHQSTGRISGNARGYGFVRTQAGDVYVARLRAHEAV